MHWCFGPMHCRHYDTSLSLYKTYGECYFLYILVRIWTYAKLSKCVHQAKSPPNKWRRFKAQKTRWNKFDDRKKLTKHIRPKKVPAWERAEIRRQTEETLMRKWFEPRIGVTYLDWKWSSGCMRYSSPWKDCCWRLTFRGAMRKASSESSDHC